MANNNVITVDILTSVLEQYKDLVSDSTTHPNGYKNISSLSEITEPGFYKLNDKELYAAAYSKTQAWVPITAGHMTRKGFEIKTYPEMSTSAGVILTDSKFGSASMEADVGGINLYGSSTCNGRTFEYTVYSPSIYLDSTPVTITYQDGDKETVEFPSFSSLGIIYFEVDSVTNGVDQYVNMWTTSTYEDSLTISEVIEGKGVEGDGFNSEVSNDYTQNKAFGTYSSVEGRTAQAGAKAFNIKAVSYTGPEGTFTLDDVTGLKEGMWYSAQVYGSPTSGNVNRYGKITNIDSKNKIVTVDNMHPDFNTTVMPIAAVIDGFDNENNMFFIPDSPTLGTRSIGSAAHSEGRSTVAARKNAHAEGNKSKALGHSSHAENTSRVYGSYAHGEGSSYVYGNYAHGEGVNTYAVGEAAHAQGRRNIAYSTDSYAGGGSSVGYDFLLNKGLNPNDIDSWTTLWKNAGTDSVERFNAAVGNNSFAHGSNNLVLGLRGTAMGKQNFIDYKNPRGALCWDAAALGSYNSVAGAHSVALGYSNTVEVGESVVLGHSNTIKALDDANPELTTRYRAVAIGNGNILTQGTQEGVVIVGRFGTNLNHDDSIFLVGTGTKDTDRKSTFGITSLGSMWQGTEHAVTGQLSGALGYKGTVSGAQSFSIGNANTIAAHKSVALGYGNNIGLTKIGDTSLGAFAAGVSNTVDSVGANAIGESNTVNASDSTAIGYNNKISTTTANASSIAIGHSNTITGGQSFAAGMGNTVSGYKNIALGKYLTISGSGGEGKAVVGRYNKSSSAVFVVGNGSAGTTANPDANRSNALEVFADGTIQAHSNATVKLEIFYDDGSSETYHLIKSKG